MTAAFQRIEQKSKMFTSKNQKRNFNLDMIACTVLLCLGMTKALSHAKYPTRPPWTQQTLTYSGCQGEGRHRSKRSEGASGHHPNSNATPRDGPSPTGKAMHLGGTQGLRWMGKRDLPNGEFTVAMWVKPEGGQKDPVSILGRQLKYSP